MYNRFHTGIDQEVLIELLHAGKAVLVHDESNQCITLMLAQFVEDGVSHALPCFRLETSLDRLLQVAGDGEALFGCSYGADNTSPPDNRGD